MGLPPLSGMAAMACSCQGGYEKPGCGYGILHIIFLIHIRFPGKSDHRKAQNNWLCYTRKVLGTKAHRLVHPEIDFLDSNTYTAHLLFLMFGLTQCIISIYLRECIGSLNPWYAFSHAAIRSFSGMESKKSNFPSFMTKQLRKASSFSKIIFRSTHHGYLKLTSNGLCFVFRPWDIQTFLLYSNRNQDKTFIVTTLKSSILICIPVVSKVELSRFFIYCTILSTISISSLLIAAMFSLWNPKHGYLLFKFPTSSFIFHPNMNQHILQCFKVNRQSCRDLEQSLLCICSYLPRPAPGHIFRHIIKVMQRMRRFMDYTAKQRSRVGIPSQKYLLFHLKRYC